MPGLHELWTPPPGPRRPGSNDWSLNEEQSQPFFRQAMDLGINFFDTANVYATGDSERVVGRLLKANARREDVVLATKVNGVMRDGPNGGGLSRKEIYFELDESLKRLETDYVDLYRIHRWDKTTPIEETLETLNDVVRAGKVRYIGASSMWAWQFSKALYTSEQHGWARFVAMQPHYNLLYREEEREMLPLCREQGIGVIPWSPLARGRLARPADAAPTKRLGDGRFGKNDLLQPRRMRTARWSTAWQKVAAERGVPHGAGGAGLDAGQAGDYVTDCRRDQAASPGGCGCGGLAEADRGGDEVAGRAVRAARGGGPELTGRRFSRAGGR